MADIASYDMECINLAQLSKKHLLDRVVAAMDGGGDLRAKDLPYEVGKMREQLSNAEQRVEQLIELLGAGPGDEEELVAPSIPPLDGYEMLADVLTLALNQAASGKGKERHAKDGEPFQQQKICEITRRVGLGYPLGQATKKAYESLRIGDRGPAELLGAINYLAAAVIVMREEIDVGK